MGTSAALTACVPAWVVAVLVVVLVAERVYATTNGKSVEYEG